MGVTGLVVGALVGFVLLVILTRVWQMFGEDPSNDEDDE